ncbi:hypothetical protein C8J48_1071 [Desmospora activa DSM 45169]|uniref:Uncharacterized protein n=1 Tax=Desmospora activa DSM 45169 TaxID=1121389 RepID=A0A2T4Z9C2_9BACL|nr:hypothetical protein C8J48_1071 [Desmospora activa DSM 45169]
MFIPPIITSSSSDPIIFPKALADIDRLLKSMIMVFFLHLKPHGIIVPSSLLSVLLKLAHTHHKRLNHVFHLKSKQPESLIRVVISFIFNILIHAHRDSDREW